MQLSEALKYATTDLPLSKLVDRAIQQQSHFRPTPQTPTPAHNQFSTEPYLSQLKQIDPNAGGLDLKHLHNAAAVLAGTADHSLLGEDFHNSKSPLVEYLKRRLQPKAPVPTPASLGPVLSSVDGDVSGSGAATTKSRSGTLNQMKMEQRGLLSIAKIK